MSETPRLSDDEVLFRRIVEDSPAAVALLTDEALPRVLYASPRLEEISGFGAGDLIARPELWMRRVHPEESSSVLDRWTEAIEDGTRFEAEYRFLHRSGEWRWFHETSTAVSETDGSIAYRQSFVEDISSERFAKGQAERSEARYRSLVERLPVVVYVDSDETEPRSLYVSPNAREVFGYEPSDFLADSTLWFSSMHPDDLERVRGIWTESIRTRQPFHAEYRNLKPDGTVVWVRDHSILVCGDDGQPLFWQGVLHDITSEHEAAMMLDHSERRYRALVEQVPAIMYEMGPDDERRTLFVSPHVESILGYPRQEWLDQPDIWVELLHPDDREHELAAHDLHNETGESWQREYRLIASDGRQVWVRDQAELIADADGSRWLGVMLDISPQKEAEALLQLANDELEMRVLTRTTQLEDANEMMAFEIGERRHAEDRLSQTEERFRTLVEHMPSVAYTWHVSAGDDAKPTLLDTYTSPRIEDLLGFTVDEWESDPDFWETRIHPHDRQRVLASAQRTTSTGDPFNEEFRYLAKDGRVVWVLERAMLLSRDVRGRPEFFQGLILDITARKRAEEKAAVAEERFRVLAERGPLVVYEFELEHADPPLTHMRYLSPSAAELLSMPTSVWEGKLETWLSMMHPDDVERMTELAARAFGTGGPWSHVFRMIAGDGRVVWLLDRGCAIEHDEHGRPRRFQGVLIDVTEQSEAHAALEASEATMRALVEAMPAVPWTEIVDPATGTARFAFIGPQVEHVFGYTSSELLAEPDHFFRMVHADDRERVIASNDRCNRTGEPWNELYRVMHRDGSVRWILSSAHRTTNEARSAWHGVAVDVTDHVTTGAIADRVGERAAHGAI